MRLHLLTAKLNNIMCRYVDVSSPHNHIILNSRSTHAPESLCLPTSPLHPFNSRHPWHSAGAACHCCVRAVSYARLTGAAPASMPHIHSLLYSLSLHFAATVFLPTLRRNRSPQPTHWTKTYINMRTFFHVKRI